MSSAYVASKMDGFTLAKSKKIMEKYPKFDAETHPSRKRIPNYVRSHGHWPLPRDLLPSKTQRKLVHHHGKARLQSLTALRTKKKEIFTRHSCTHHGTMFHSYEATSRSRLLTSRS